MSNIKRLTLYEEAMETVCDECQTRYPVKDNYCQCNCMVRQIWRNILDEKKAREENKMELSTVSKLMEQLKELPPDTKVYVLGTTGYLHITADSNGKAVVNFDDSEEI